jgi:hypothetical protein
MSVSTPTRAAAGGARADASLKEFDELSRILSFRDYISKRQIASKSREDDAILAAVNDLIGRLQRSLAPVVAAPKNAC